VLICHCRKVNDGVARAAIAAGATDLEGLAEICRAGSGCGGCHPMLEELLRGAGSKVGGSTLGRSMFAESTFAGSRSGSSTVDGSGLDGHFSRSSRRVLSPA
jgi:bacterioferritin-associated ferredoxin